MFGSRLLERKPYFEVYCLAITVLYKDGICLSSDVFDIERRNTHEQAEWFKCTLDVKDLNDYQEVKVIDKNISVQW